MCGGRGEKPSDSDVCIFVHHTFYAININFHHVYLDTDWGMHTVAFIGIGFLSTEDIPVHGMMENLQFHMLHDIGMVYVGRTH